MSFRKNAPSGAKLALAALFCTAFPVQAADETYLRPILDVEQSWDSNIYNDSEDEEGSFVTTISPGLWFENQGELGHARLGVTARARNVWNESDLTGIDALVRGDLERKLTPRLSVFGNGLFDSYSGYEEISEGSTVAGLPGEVLFGEQPSWKRDQLGGGVRYLLTERLSFSLDGYAGRVNYESIDGNATTSAGSYRDRTLLGGGTSLLYQLTAQDQVLLDVEIDDTEYQDLGTGTNDTAIWSSRIGWNRVWTQDWSSAAEIGFSITDSVQKGVPQSGGFAFYATCGEIFGILIPCPQSGRYPLGQDDFSSSGSALVGKLSLRRVFARGLLELSYNRDTSSVGGSGRTNFDIDSFTLGWRQRLAERVQLSITANYQLLHSVSDEIPNYAADVFAFPNGTTVAGCRLGGSLVVVDQIPNPLEPTELVDIVQCAGGSTEEKRQYTTLVGRLEWQLRRRLSSYLVATYRASETDRELGSFGEIQTEDLDKFTIGAGFRWYHDLGL